MKRLNFVIALCLLASCSRSHNSDIAHASEISVVRDITDSLECLPLPDPILSLYGFEIDPSQAALFRLTLITDKLLNPVEEIRIDNGYVSERNNVNEEVDYRERIVLSFYDAVRQAVNSFHTRYMPCAPLPHSECFATIANELERLSTRKAAQRILIVFGDLAENTEEFSCYTVKGQQMLHENPEEVARLFLKRHSLPNNLQGITVYLVYNPRTREQDIRFDRMIGIYKRLLHGRGARIVVQATNKSYQP